MIRFRSIRMFVLALSTVAALAVSASAAQVYDFSTIPTGSAFPGTAMNGQDNWITIAGNATARTDLDVVPGISGKHAYGQTTSQIARINNGAFSYSIVGDMLTMGFVGRINSTATTAMALGYDANSNSAIAGADEIGFQFGYASNRWLIQQADGGATTLSDPVGLGGSGHTWRMVIVADLAANGGNGSGSLFVQQVGSTTNTPVVDTLTPVAGLQNVNLGILNMAGAAGNPANWNGMYIRLGNGNMEDLTIESVPEPSSLALLSIGFAGLVARRRKK